jgi:hypothetical protein
MGIAHLPAHLGQNLAQRIDTQASVIYIGSAPMNSLSSDPIWSIKALNLSGSLITVLWANGNDLNINIWDNRASLSYS